MRSPRPGPRATLRRFLSSETAGGVVLMAAAAIALIAANSDLAADYEAILHVEVGGVGLVDAVNDGLMALFFLLVGLEIKRELIAGELATWRKRALPGLAALGGMIVPALIFTALNAGTAGLRGWAIPSATDIAFSLAVLALLGPRVPVSLKVFLTALAILDDLGAVMIIAIFYAHEPSLAMLGLAAVAFLALVGLNYLRVTVLAPYLILGAALWYFVLNSGVHATIAGVLLAATIPLRTTGGDAAGESSPLARLENALGPYVGFAILPIFGFVNAGVSFAGAGVEALGHPITLGVALGLFFGKQAGVFGSVLLATRLGIAEAPSGATAIHIYGVAILCGIGFTMSLFIGLLAFPGSVAFVSETKIGVLSGSLASAILGFLVLRFASRRRGPAGGAAK